MGAGHRTGRAGTAATSPPSSPQRPPDAPGKAAVPHLPPPEPPAPAAAPTCCRPRCPAALGQGLPGELRAWDGDARGAGELRDTCLGSGRAREPVGSRACFGVASAAPGAPWLPEGADPPVPAGLRMLSRANSVASGSRGTAACRGAACQGPCPGRACLGHRAAPFSCFSSHERKQGPANSRVL